MIKIHKQRPGVLVTSRLHKELSPLRTVTAVHQRAAQTYRLLVACLARLHLRQGPVRKPAAMMDMPFAQKGVAPDRMGESPVQGSGDVSR